MQRAEFFDGVSFKDVAQQVSNFFIANAAFVGVSLSISIIENRCQAIVLYTP